MSAPAAAARDDATGLDLYGYAGTIVPGPDLSEDQQHALDMFNLGADRLRPDAFGDARIRAVEALASQGLFRGIAPDEILRGCVFAADQTGYMLRESTIRAAVQSALRKHGGAGEDELSAPKDGRTPFDPHASRIGDIFTTSPAAPDFALPGIYPIACGQENGVGGTSKTTRRLWEKMHFILNRALYGRQPKEGATLIVTKEDNVDIFKYRIHKIAAAMDLSPAEQKRVAENTHVLDLTGDIAARLVTVDRNGNLQPTDLAERIIRGYRREGLVQVDFDPWNAFSPGERFVNDAEAALMTCGALISRELACNVCYVGHVSKTVGRNGIIDAHSGRGGAAMGDNARFVLNYLPHDPKDKDWTAPASAERAAAQGNLFRLHVTKQSYAKRPTEPFWIERQGYAFTVHRGAPASPAARQQAEGERIKAFVLLELERGTRYMGRPLEEQHDRYGMGRNKARQVISWLLSAGGLVERPLPEQERRGKLTAYLEPVFAPESALTDGDPFT